MRNYGESEAEHWNEKLKKLVKEIDINTIKLAMKFRYANKRRGLSFIDCVGYSVARKKWSYFSYM